MTRKQKVLELLVGARGFSALRLQLNGQARVVAVNGYVRNWAIESAEYGGTQGTRRLRELRASGIEIEMRRLKDGDGKPTGTFCYRLKTDPKLIDFEKCCLKESNNDREIQGVLF